MKQTVQNRFLSLLLVLSLMLGLFPLTVPAADDATEQVTEIATLEELIAFRDRVNAEPGSTASAILTADIDLAGAAWEPFAPASGYVTEAYAGTFDGNGHTISGLLINSSESNQGLFGVINGGVIKNLAVEGSVTSSNNYVGGIVGKMQQGTLENCSFAGTVVTTKSGGYAGGLVGYAGNSKTQCAAIRGCASSANVIGETRGTVGGIVGYAKFTEISDCYNTGAVTGASRNGGIAGQLQNECTAKNCYNIGKTSGSATSAGICDFLFTTSALENCYAAENLIGAGAGAVGEDCGAITDVETLTECLGDAFCADKNGINDGYPVLCWQNGTVAVPKEPKIEITGSTALAMNNNGEPVFTVLTVRYTDIDEQTPVEWSVLSGEDTVHLTAPDNAPQNNAVVTVFADKPGKAVVCAEADGLTAEAEIAVTPFITTVTLAGDAVVGNSVSASVFTLGGEEYDYENFPALKYIWKYLTAEDYEAGNTASSDYRFLSDIAGRTYTVPEELAGCYLSFEIWIGTECKTPSRPVRVMTAAEGVLNADKNALSFSDDERCIKAETTLNLPQSGENGATIVWSSDNDALIDPVSGKVTLPEEQTATVTLTAALTYEDMTAEKSFVFTVYSVRAVEEEKANKQLALENAVKALGASYSIHPVYGEDTNVLDIFRNALKEKSDLLIDVSIDAINEVYGGGAVAENGDITYYYVDPNRTPAIPFASYRVTFMLAWEGVQTTVEVPVIIGWDVEKVKETMRAEITDGITPDTETPYTANFELPKVVDGKKWALVSWSSSDETVLSVRERENLTADTLFDPYVCTVRRGVQDKTVTLTAAVKFGLTSDIIGNEEPILLIKTFTVTVAALDGETAAAIEQGLSDKLDYGFERVGLRDAVTGEKLQASDGVYTATHDILLPTTRDFRVDGKDYPVTVLSDNDDVLVSPDVANAARVAVLRPAPDKQAETVTLTVLLSDKDTGISTAKHFTVCVPALTTEEIDAEKALMDRVAVSYFDGIRGSNTEADNIQYNLKPFWEVYEKNGELVWVRDNRKTTGSGIVPTPLDGWETLEAWRLFRSSNPAVISHENLLVTMQQNGKAVTVTSALSSETLGVYGKLYREDPVKYADYAPLAELYYREVSAELVVRGRTTGKNTKPLAVEEKITVTFRLDSSSGTLLAKTEYADLDETMTAFDLFKKALDENGYTYTAQGTYVTSITTADGKTIAELDEGPRSGWLFKVNGKMPDVGMGAYGLKNGDAVLVYFTKDYMDDYNEGSSSGGGSSSGSSGSDTEKTDDKTSENTDKKDNTDETQKTPDGDSESDKQDKESPFTDILMHWGKDAIEEIYARGLMKGVSETAFAPDETLTRGMFVAVLYRIEGEPKQGESDVRFADVAADAWYADAAVWAKAGGIVNGVSETAFAPDECVTREQMAAILYRYAAYKALDVSVSAEQTMESFDDADTVSEYAKPAVLWAISRGILTGKSGKMLDPCGKATRAEAAAVFVRFDAVLQ